MSQELAAGDTCSFGWRARRSRPGGTTAPGRVSASPRLDIRRDRRYGHRLAGDDRACRRLRRTHAWCRAATVPTAPQSLEATAGNAQVALTWTAPPRTAARRHRLQRLPRHEPGQRGPDCDRHPPRARRYTDTTAVNGTTYYYKVTALNARRRGPGLERGVGDARRAGHRPHRSAEPAAPPPATPGRPHLDGPASNGGSPSPATASTAARARATRARCIGTSAPSRATPTPPPPTAPPTTTRSPRSTRVGEGPASNEASATPARAGHRPQRAESLAAPPPATPGRPHLDRPASNGGSPSPATTSTAAPARATRALTPHRHLTGHDLHRHHRRQRHHLLLQGDRRQRRRRGRAIERASATPERRPPSPPLRRACTRDRRQRPGHPRLDGPASNGGSPSPATTSTAAPARATRPDDDRHLHRTLHRHHRRQRHHLLLQGDRPQRASARARHRTRRRRRRAISSCPSSR